MAPSCLSIVGLMTGGGVMAPLRPRMIEDMQLRGLAPHTQRSYLQAIQRLALHYHKSPDQITDEELRQYFLYLHHEKHLARSTTTVVLAALKFFWLMSVQR